MKTVTFKTVLCCLSIIFATTWCILSFAQTLISTEEIITCGSTITLYFHVAVSNQDNTGVANIEIDWVVLSNGGHPIHLTFISSSGPATDANGDANATFQSDGVPNTGNPGDVQA